MTKPAHINLAYLAVANPAPNISIGGLMVTDRRGLPLEFRYTEPIQPSKIQQVLYGQVLNAYIKREVILETLLRNLDVTFKCLLVEDVSLLEHTGRGYSVLRIAATKSPPLGAVGKRQAMDTGEILLQVTPEGNPIRLTLGGAAGPPSDPAVPEESEARHRPDPVELLLDAGQTMDLTEPLRRIEKALDIICQEEGITTANPAPRPSSI
jgi:hypothetical protein